MAKKRTNYQTDILDLFTPITAKTPNQQVAMAAYQKGQHLLLTGYPGTGKTFLALALAIETLKKAKQQQRIIIFRSSVPTRDIGALKGHIGAKMAPYEAPYIDICNKLFHTSDNLSAYITMARAGYIDFVSTSFERGKGYANSIFILDEFQNMTEHELLTILTRVEESCRIILSGDIMQTDLLLNKTGFNRLVRTLRAIPRFTHIDFEIDDIVRSGFVKEFIIKWLENDVKAENIPILLSEDIQSKTTEN